MKGCATCERDGHRPHRDASPVAGRCPEAVEKRRARNRTTAAAYREAHPEEARARWRASRRAHLEKRSAERVAYYASHSEKEKANVAAWYAVPTNKLKASITKDTRLLAQLEQEWRERYGDSPRRV